MPLSKDQKMGFKTNYLLIQKVTPLTFIKLPFVIKIFVLSIFEWLFDTGFIILEHSQLLKNKEGMSVKVQTILQELIITRKLCKHDPRIITKIKGNIITGFRPAHDTTRKRRRTRKPTLHQTKTN